MLAMFWLDCARTREADMPIEKMSGVQNASRINSVSETVGTYAATDQLPS